jgi:hypothetical protein
MPRRKSISFVKPQVIQVIGGAGMPAMMPSMQPVVIDSLSATLNVFNSNPYLIGVFYLFLNLGGRFLSLELTKRQEWFLSQSYVRPFILFAVMFISTRNIAVAFWTTVCILSVLWVFANENSDFCLIPGWKQNIVPATNNYDDVMNRIKNLLKSDEPHDDGHPEPPSEQELPNEDLQVVKNFLQNNDIQEIRLNDDPQDKQEVQQEAQQNAQQNAQQEAKN